MTPREALLLVLDQVDYTVGACSPTDMVAAALPTVVIDRARAALAGGHPPARGDVPPPALLALPSEWLEPGAVVPVDAQTTSHLLRMVRELLKRDVHPKGGGNG